MTLPWNIPQQAAQWLAGASATVLLLVGLYALGYYRGGSAVRADVKAQIEANNKDIATQLTNREKEVRAEFSGREVVRNEIKKEITGAIIDYSKNHAPVPKDRPGSCPDVGGITLDGMRLINRAIDSRQRESQRTSSKEVPGAVKAP